MPAYKTDEADVAGGERGGQDAQHERRGRPVIQPMGVSYNFALIARATMITGMPIADGAANLSMNTLKTELFYTKYESQY